MPASNLRSYRLHLESQRDDDSIYHLTPQVWHAAAARHGNLTACLQVSYGWDEEGLERSLADADFLVGTRFSKHVLNAAGGLRWIHTTGAGVDGLAPLAELRNDLLLTNSSGIHSDKAQEFVLMALLMLQSDMPRMIAAQSACRWDPHFTATLAAKTALVIGYGDLGQAAAAAARSQAMRIVAVSRSGRSQPGAADLVLPVARLDEVLPAANFVVLTTPLTQETHNLLDATRLALLPRGAGIVNIGRAGLLDQAALFAGLRSGALGGAVLEVVDPEPLPRTAEHWRVPNLIVTPHISCDAPDYADRVLDLWFDNFGRFVRGETLRNLVDRRLGY